MPALSPGAAGVGLELSPEEWENVVYQPLVAGSALMSLDGVTLHQSYVPLHLPSIAVDPLGDGAWRGPNELITPTDLSTSEVVLLPRGLKAVKVIVVLSNETVRSSGGLGAAQVLITARLVEVIDHALLCGSSAAGITGLVASAGTTIAHSTEPVLDDFFDALTDAEDASASPRAWIINTRTLGSLRKIRDTLGHPLLAPNPAQVGGDMLLGRPVVATPHMTLGTALLIDPASVHIGVDLDGRADLLLELYAATDATGLRVVSRWDVKVINPAGLVAITGLGPS
jgi:HK97 family phage major capsid protein